MSHKVSNNVAYCMLNVWSHAKISIATQILRLFCFTRSAELGFLTRTEDCHKPWTVSAGCSTTLAEYVCYLMGAGGWGGGGLSGSVLLKCRCRLDVKPQGTIVIPIPGGIGTFCEVTVVTKRARQRRRLL